MGRSDPKLSQEGQWFALWDLLFPGRRRPRSAYHDVGVAEELSSFREFCAANSEDILDSAAQVVMATGEWPGFARLEAEERRSIFEWMGSEGFETAYRMWRQERTATTTMAIAGMGSESSNSGAMSAQSSATPAEPPSLADSGVILGEIQPLPSVIESPFEGGDLEPGRNEILVDGEEDNPGEEGESEGGPPVVGNLQSVTPADDNQITLAPLGFGFEPWPLVEPEIYPMDAALEAFFADGDGMSSSGYT
jgi:hypothetical protein